MTWLERVLNSSVSEAKFSWQSSFNLLLFVWSVCTDHKGKRNLENDQEITVRTNITHVLNLAQEVNLKADIKEIATEYNRERDLPFVYKKLNFGDTPDQDILSELESAIEFIHEAHSSNERHNVLVNCVQGISRSASVVLAYLMKYERMSLRAAYDHVRERRAVADPRKAPSSHIDKATRP